MEYAYSVCQTFSKFISYFNFILSYMPTQESNPPTEYIIKAKTGPLESLLVFISLPLQSLLVFDKCTPIKTITNICCLLIHCRISDFSTANSALTNIFVSTQRQPSLLSAQKLKELKSWNRMEDPSVISVARKLMISCYKEMLLQVRSKLSQFGWEKKIANCWFWVSLFPNCLYLLFELFKG